MEVKLKQGKGIVTTIKTYRGFGFIQQEDGTDLFFHANGVCSPQFADLREGYQVEFQIVESEKDGQVMKRAIGIVAI